MTAINITPEEHSDIVGGSTAARRLGCPRSLHLEGLVPKLQDDSVYAREGTALHEMMAVVLGTGVEDPLTLLPFTYDRKHDSGAIEWSFTVTADLWDEKGRPALAAFDDFVERVENEWEEEFTFLIEQRVAFPGIPGAYGTSDIVGKCANEVFVIDWKFGHGAVDAFENAQLMFYAVGAMNTCADFLKVNATPNPGERPITMVIIQPMVDPGLTVWETNGMELSEMAQRLREAVDEARHQKNEARIDKGSWCKYARCKTICPLHTRDVSALSRLQERANRREDDGGASAFDWEKHNNPHDNPHDGPDEAFDWGGLYAEMMSLVPTVEAWATEVKKQAHAAAVSGLTLPGFKLTPKRAGNRAWADDDETVAKFFKGRRFTLDQYMPRHLVSLKAGEDMLKEAGKELPEAMISKPGSSGFNLVPDGSPGVEVAPTATRIAALRDKLAAFEERGE